MARLGTNPRRRRRQRRSAPVPPELRGISAASALGRIAIGASLALAPGRALAALGFPEASPATIVTARIAGVRDIVLGAVTLAALTDRDRLRAASLANSAVDAGDALTFAGALGGGQEVVRSAGVRGLAAAAPAAAGSAWIASRLA